MYVTVYVYLSVSENHELKFGGLVSSSNEMVEDVAIVELSDPCLWTVDFRL